MMMIMITMTVPALYNSTGGVERRRLLHGEKCDDDDEDDVYDNT